MKVLNYTILSFFSFQIINISNIYSAIRSMSVKRNSQAIISQPRISLSEIQQGRKNLKKVTPKQQPEQNEIVLQDNSVVNPLPQQTKVTLQDVQKSLKDLRKMQSIDERGQQIEKVLKQHDDYKNTNVVNNDPHLENIVNSEIALRKYEMEYSQDHFVPGQTKALKKVEKAFTSLPKETIKQYPDIISDMHKDLMAEKTLKNAKKYDFDLNNMSDNKLQTKVMFIEPTGTHKEYQKNPKELNSILSDIIEKPQNQYVFSVKSMDHSMAQDMKQRLNSFKQMLEKSTATTIAHDYSSQLLSKEDFIKKIDAMTVALDDQIVKTTPVIQKIKTKLGQEKKTIKSTWKNKMFKRFKRKNVKT